MVKKIVAYGCWSNERYIAEKGSAGVIHGHLFDTETAAREYYTSLHRSPDDVIVRVTVETLK